MTQFFTNLLSVFVKTAPYWGLFLGTFALCYVLTPLCRELARKCGMVDAPSARRINTVPTPRAGGLAVFLSVTVAAHLEPSLSASTSPHPIAGKQITVFSPSERARTLRSCSARSASGQRTKQKEKEGSHSRMASLFLCLKFRS